VQQFLRAADLDKVSAAANKVFGREKPMSWKLNASASRGMGVTQGA
jgi:hypothetical protein